MTQLNLRQPDKDHEPGPDLPSFLSEADPVEETGTDRLLGVRVVLLIATGVSLFIAPMFISLIFGAAWLVAMVWPKK